METTSKAAEKELGTWSFYVAFVLSLLFEATLVRLLGFTLGFIALLLGGAALGLFALKYTDPSKKARDPFFRAAIWCIERQPFIGYLVLGIFLGGSPGTAVAYKKMHSRHTLALTLLSAFLFALTWALIFSL